MSEWQVSFHIVPERALKGRPKVVAPAELEAKAWWAEIDLDDYQEKLARVAPPASSNADHEMWGSTDTNHVDVWLERRQPMRITATVDVRKLDSKFGAMLLVFVKSAQAVLVRSDGRVVEATINAYSGALRNAPQWKFANDPAAWIAEQQAKGEFE